MNRPSLIRPLLLLLACTCLAGVVRAQGISLDSDLRAHLATLKPVTGPAVAAAAFDGQVVVVTFFASWCPPCRDEFRALNALREEFADKPARIVAINVFEAFDDNDAARMQRFLNDTMPAFPVIKGNANTRKRFGAVDRIPTVFVFDKSGQPVMHFVHARGASKMSVDADELKAAVTRALNR